MLGPNLPLDLGRSVEHWRHLALLRSGGWSLTHVPLKPSIWGRKEFLGADITAGTVAKYRRAFVDFNFPCDEGVKIRFDDVGKQQLLNEFGETWGFVASDKGVMFLDNHDTQRGEAQITHENGDCHQLANLSLLTKVTELVADPAFSRPRYGYSSVCPPPTPTPSTNVRKGWWRFVSEPSQSTVRRSGDLTASWNRPSTC